jgi:hypothetical protein
LAQPPPWRAAQLALPPSPLPPSRRGPVTSRPNSPPRAPPPLWAQEAAQPHPLRIPRARRATVTPAAASPPAGPTCHPLSPPQTPLSSPAQPALLPCPLAEPPPPPVLVPRGKPLPPPLLFSLPSLLLSPRTPAPFPRGGRTRPRARGHPARGVSARPRPAFGARQPHPPRWRGAARLVRPRSGHGVPPARRGSPRPPPSPAPRGDAPGMVPACALAPGPSGSPARRGLALPWRPWRIRPGAAVASPARLVGPAMACGQGAPSSPRPRSPAPAHARSRGPVSARHNRGDPAQRPVPSPAVRGLELGSRASGARPELGWRGYGDPARSPVPAMVRSALGMALAWCVRGSALACARLIRDASARPCARMLA